MTEFNLTLLKDQLKTIALEILDYERERKGVKEDMVDLKTEMQGFVPKHLIPKIIKVYFQKSGVKPADIDEYKQVCDALGLSYICGWYQPGDKELEPEQKEYRDKVISIMKRYETLQDECNELSVNIRNCYARAKAMGISVPLLKKLVDFVLHPDKLRAYHEDTPLLEAYVEVIPDIE